MVGGRCDSNLQDNTPAASRCLSRLARRYQATWVLRLHAFCIGIAHSVRHRVCGPLVRLCVALWKFACSSGVRAIGPGWRVAMGGGIACCCDVQWSCRCCTCWWLLRLCQPQSLLRMCIALAAVPTMPMLPSGASVVSFSLMLMENYKYTLLCNCMQIVLLHSMLRKKTGGMTRRMRGEKRAAKTPEASAKRTDGPIDPPSGVARRQPVRWTPLPTKQQQYLWVTG